MHRKNVHQSQPSKGHRVGNISRDQHVYSETASQTHRLNTADTVKRGGNRL